MAEPEELDEDLFADLYDAENNDAPIRDVAFEESAAAPPVSAAPAEEHVDTGMMGAGEDSTAPQIFTEQVPSFDDSTQADSTWRASGTTPAHENGAHSAEPEYTGIAIKEDGKMFIGGLNWETTDESLRRHFEDFGEVVECTVMRDAATGRSRGFGFLTFKDPKVVNIVMVKEHYLDGKIIDPKRAIPRDEQERTSKIFVGGVSQEATDEDFRNYFMQYGRVIDATLMMDKDTKRPRGFGFVTFDSEAAVEATLRGDLMIHGKPIEVKRAQPRGNVQQEEDQPRRGGRGRGGFREEHGGGGGQGAQTNPMFQNGMTPQMMAQYFQRMQQYFASMMAGMGGGGGMGGMMGGMNPAMMAQMKQMQAMQAMQQGGQGGNMQNMNPQMMQQMQQMQQQMQMMQGNQGGQGNQGTMNGAPAGPSGPNPNARRGGHSSPANQNEQAFEQSQGRRGGGGGGNQNVGYQQGGPTSWEGMYDDVPQPDGGGGRGGFGRGGGGPPKAPSAAPANAPTGPKNHGVPGANYRGGGRGSRRGFHPYGGRR